MKITKLTYQDSNWHVDGLEFEQVNLLVGKNSVGKSRTIMTIDLLVKQLTQKRDMNWGAQWMFELETENGSNIRYSFESRLRGSGQISQEEIEKDGKILLKRKVNGRAELFNRLTDRFDLVYPPDNKLIVHTTRDLRKYPVIEEIITWADNAFGFKFGNISPGNATRSMEYGILTSVDEIPFLYQSLSPTSKARIVNSFNAIGYEIVDIQFHERGAQSYISVKELGLEKRHPHYKLSQGMFRSLALIIYIEYLRAHKRASTLIIDDLCEGLDYERATKLGKWVFNTCAESQIQLIATSNDSHLMDVIDIENWNILQREGNRVHALNFKNSSTLFDEFRFTGLSNFDFFASDFILQHP